MRAQQTIPLELGAEPVLDLHADATMVEVVPVAAGEAPRVEVEGRGEFDGRAPLKVEQRGGVVFVRLMHDWAEHWPVPLEIHKLVLHVPAHVKARLHCDMGRLRVRGLAGCDLEASSNAGKLELTDTRGRLKLAVNAGSVSGERVGGTFDVRSDAGSVRLSIDALDDGEHLIRTAMGSVRVELAKGLDVKVETYTSLGSARSSYPDHPHAKATLRLEAQLGSVRVREAGQAEDPRHGDWPDWRRWWAGPRPPPPPAPPPPSPPPGVDAPPAGDRDASMRRILEMVQAGKLTAVEAERLLRAMGP
jgi:hypothetical protein